MWTGYLNKTNIYNVHWFKNHFKWANIAEREKLEMCSPVSHPVFYVK